MGQPINRYTEGLHQQIAHDMGHRPHCRICTALTETIQNPGAELLLFGLAGELYLTLRESKNVLERQEKAIKARTPEQITNAEKAFDEVFRNRTPE